jgi:predicted secreted hydrolase
LVRRRAFLASLAALAVKPAWPAEVVFPEVTPDYKLSFPRDHGAHRDFRTEWWYVTGWLKTARGEDLGFQVTFFRTRTPYASDNPSTFAPRQILLAHAALADQKHGKLRHDQRAARPALGVAGAEEGTTRVWIDAWRMALEGQTYRASIPARDFTLDLGFTAKRAPLLQGIDGVSRKGREAGEASYYYSRPALAVTGSIARGAGTEDVAGLAWLDHEWSSQYMAAGAAGWDWIGINLDDGGALMAFRMRAKGGGVLYAGGTIMHADGRAQPLEPDDVAFMPLRQWRSPRTATAYPVAMRVRTKDTVWRIEPLFDDQELDSRSSTATIYWEGAVRVFREQGGAASPAGRGYLELTGYWQPMRI